MFEAIEILVPKLICVNDLITLKMHKRKCGQVQSSRVICWMSKNISVGHLWRAGDEVEYLPLVQEALGSRQARNNPDVC